MNESRIRAAGRVFNYDGLVVPQFEIRAQADGTDADLMLYDEIGFWGVTAKRFVLALSELDGVQNINLRINSPGGDVFDGIAMFNALRRSPARVTATVDGLAASAASVVMMAADEIRVEGGASIMIHEPWGIGIGNATELRALADVLDKKTDDLMDIYRSRGPVAENLRALLAAETWFTGQEAVEAGLADAAFEAPAEDAQALARWDTTAFDNAPGLVARTQAELDAKRETRDRAGRQHLAHARRQLEIERLRI